MKKILWFAILLFLISSCYSAPEYKIVEKDIPLEEIYADMLKKHPNMELNDLTRKEACDYFIRAAKDTIKKCNLFEGVPMEIRTINKTRNKGYIIQLYAWRKPSLFDYHYDLNSVNFDMIGYISDSLAHSLDQEKFYIVKGQYVKNISFTSMQTMLEKGTIGITSAVCLERDAIVSSQYEANFGYMVYKFDDIIPFERREKERISLIDTLNALP